MGLATYRATSEAVPPGDGDVEARYATYRRRLLGYARKNFPELDADDIVQETLARAYAHRAGLEERASPWPWLLTVARNVACDERRALTRCTPGTGLSAALERDPDDLFLRMVEHRDQELLVHEALRRLRRRHRRLIELHDIAGYGGTELADHLGVSIGAFRTRLMRARRDLRDAVVAMGGRYAVAPLFAPLVLRLRLRLRRSVSQPPSWLAGVDPGVSNAAGLFLACALMTAVGLGSVLSPPAGDHQGAPVTSGLTRSAPAATARQPVEVGPGAGSTLGQPAAAAAGAKALAVPATPSVSMRVPVSVTELPRLAPEVAVPLETLKTSIDEQTTVGDATVTVDYPAPPPPPSQLCGALDAVTCVGR